MSTSFRVLSLSEADRPEVLAYLDRQPGASIFYRPGWNRVVSETWGHRCAYFAAYRSGELVGLFPVTIVRHPILGKKWVAQPYHFDNGAPLAGSRAIALGLVARALESARRDSAHYLEIRHTKPLEDLVDLRFDPVETQILTTNVPIEGIELSKIRRGHRRDVRRAMDAGVEILETRSLADLRRFRTMYLRESRDHGAPQAGWSYFANMHRLLGDGMRLYLARLADMVIGGILTIEHGDSVFARCIAQYAPEARAFPLGKLLIFHTMQAAAARGCKRYSLGISWAGDAGLLATKEGWRGATVPVHCYVAPITRQAPAPGSYFEGYRLAKWCWKRLPLPAVDWAGAKITRWVC